MPEGLYRPLGAEIEPWMSKWVLGGQNRHLEGHLPGLPGPEKVPKTYFWNRKS